MTTNPVAIGSHLTVKDGRHKGKQVEVLEVKGDTVRCKFIGLNEQDARMQQSGSDFQPTWLDLDNLIGAPTGSEIAQTEEA